MKLFTDNSHIQQLKSSKDIGQLDSKNHMLTSIHDPTTLIHQKHYE